MSHNISVSGPIIASMFNRINEESIAAAKPPTGFSNPALYKNRAMFNSVVKGSMVLNSMCKGKDFNATKRRGPISGLVTPNYPQHA